MSKVIIIVNAQVDNGKISPKEPIAEKMAVALSKSIIKSNPCHEIKIVGGAQIWSKSLQIDDSDQDIVYCPLTIKLPDWFNFPAQHIYCVCRDLEKRRKWVEQNFNYKTTHDDLSLGDLWLPIIFDGENCIYSDFIGEGVLPNYYQQPYDLPSEIHHSLYTLAQDLLLSIQAIPSVYLLQFKMLDNNIIFDRLWPFPACPAIASINIQKPDLFDYHWDCLSNKSTIN
jgi:hypothetical protein